MSLDLDERQRAMLEEMHVRVWWPRRDTSVRLEPVEVSFADRPVGPRNETRMPKESAHPLPEPVHVAGSHVGVSYDAVDAMDWPELSRTVAACTACKLCAGRKAPVFSTEAPARQADWLVVGEPPDEQEERVGAPFAGQAGQLLDNMLRAVNLSRDGSGSAGARLTNVVKCRTVPVRNPQADELASCAAYLRREIALVKPKLILAMGRFAALSLLAESSPELAGLPLGKLRGQVHRYQGLPVVVTYHPAMLLRAREDKALAWADLCLAQSVARREVEPGGA